MKNNIVTYLVVISALFISACTTPFINVEIQRPLNEPKAIYEKSRK